MTEPPFEATDHIRVMCCFDLSTSKGVAWTEGFDAIINVFRIENSPSPASVTALIRYWTSWSATMPIWVNY